MRYGIRLGLVGALLVSGSGFAQTLPSPAAAPPARLDPAPSAAAPAQGPGQIDPVTVRASEKAPLPAHFTSRSVTRSQGWNGNPAIKPKDCTVGFANVGGQPASAADLATSLGHRACGQR